MPSPVDATQLGQLLDRHAAALELYAAQWTASPEDCVQEALIELARQPSAPERPAAWLYRVVRNRALNAARSAQRRRQHEQHASQQTSERRTKTAKSSFDPQHIVSLSDLLSTLESNARELVVLRIWGGLTWQEIADVAGGSSSAAQRNYQQALAQLRRHLEPEPCPKNNSCPTS